MVCGSASSGNCGQLCISPWTQNSGLNIKDLKTVMVGGSSPRIAAVKTGQLDFIVVTGSGKVEGEKAELKVNVNMAMNLPFHSLVQSRPEK